MTGISNYRPVVAGLVNVLLVTTSVLLNKWILCRVLSCYALLVLQCAIGFLGLVLCERCGLFALKTVHLDVILSPCVLFSMFLLIATVSLEFNSVVVYQSVRFLNLPLISTSFRSSLQNHKPLVRT